MPKRELQVIRAISDIIARTTDYHEGLRLTVQCLAERLDVDSCSIFAHDAVRNRLVMEATYGFSQDTVHRLDTPVDEGLAGECFTHHTTVNIADMHQDPRYRSFGIASEQKHHALLIVPLIVAGRAIGVLGVTRERHGPFEPGMVELAETIASPLAVFILNAGLAEREMPSKESAPPIAVDEMVLKGTAITEGVVRGRAYILVGSELLDSIQPEHADDLQQEKDLFSRALQVARDDTLRLQEEASAILAEADAAIFYAHLLLLEDPTLSRRVHQALEQGYTLRYALRIVAKAFERELSDLDNEMMRERVLDMKDVIIRILQAVDECEGVASAGHDGKLREAAKPVVVSCELLPSQLIRLPLSNLAGIVCERGGTTTHVAILARTLRIPMLVGVEDAMAVIRRNDDLIMDCSTGNCVVRPSQELVRRYRNALRYHARHREEPAAQVGVPLTADGELIRLQGNISLISELPLLEKFGAMGVGLYRTEFMFMIRTSYPTEEEQYAVFRRVVEGAHGAPVTIRILDVGGDKPLPYVNFGKEDNPFLGWRGLRFLLSMPQYLEPHLRAILRTAALGKVNLLLPMVADVDEFLEVNAVIERVKDQLGAEGMPAPPECRTGIMLEVPSVVWALPKLLPQVDFVSFGTNDLIQYMFAVDRGNARVKRWFRQLHPVVLSVLKDVCDLVNEHDGKELAICGELAGNALAAPLLVGTGLRSLSMNPWQIPRVRDVLSTVTLAECKDLLQSCIEAGRDDEVVRILRDFSRRKGTAAPAG